MALPLLRCSPRHLLGHQANSVVVSDLLPLPPHLASSDHTVFHLWASTHAQAQGNFVNQYREAYFYQTYHALLTSALKSFSIMVQPIIVISAQNQTSDIFMVTSPPEKIGSWL